MEHEPDSRVRPRLYRCRLPSRKVARMPSIVRRAKVPSAVLAGVLIAAIAGCESVTGPEGQLSSAKERWANNASSDYSVTVARSCFCVQETVGSVIVTVRNNAIQSRHYVTTGA